MAAGADIAVLGAKINDFGSGSTLISGSPGSAATFNANIGSLTIGVLSNINANVTAKIITSSAAGTLTNSGVGTPILMKAMAASTPTTTNTGSATDEYITPDALAGSNFGTVQLMFTPFDTDTDIAAGVCKQVFTVTAKEAGMNLIVGEKMYISEVVLPVTGATVVNLRRIRKLSLGDSTTQFDITDQGGNTARYTYDGTGTDPGIADSDASIRVGDFLFINAQNFNAANNGVFAVTAVAANYFEISNAALFAEPNVTIGTGSIVVSQYRNMYSTGPTLTGSTFTWDAGVVDATLDDLALGDGLVPVITSVHTTAPKGLGFSPLFRLP